MALPDGSELARQGLVAERDGFEIVGQFGFPIVRVPPGPFDEREATLRALQASSRSGKNEAGSPLFNVVTFDSPHRPPEHARPWRERLRQWTYSTLMGFLFDTKLDDEAHAHLVMIPVDDAWEAVWPQGRVRFGPFDAPMRETKELAYGDGFTGDHHPTGVFVAAGGAVRHLAERQALSVLDIAPLFLHLAGGSLPDDLEGSLPEAWLRADWREAHPVVRVPAASIPRLPAPEGPVVDDEVLIERLRSMGYVE